MKVLRILAYTAVTGAVVASITIAVQSHQAFRRLETAERIRRLGGDAYYAWQLEDKMGPSTPRDMVRSWSGNPALLTSIAYVEFSDSGVDDRVITVVRSMDSVEVLNVSGTNVSESALQSFRNVNPSCKVVR